jgi:hypothetical protein
MSAARRRFTITELLAVLVLLTILAYMLLCSLAVAKKKSGRITCVSSLKMCDLAFTLWENDHAGKFPMGVSTNRGGTLEYGTGEYTFRHFQIMSNELGTPKTLTCSADTRHPADDFIHFNNSNVSYFVAPDADDAHPQRFLVGDRNLSADNAPKNGILKLSPGQHLGWTSALHNHVGNLGLADGSVQQLTSNGVQALLQASGEATNVWRISLPE